MGCILMRGKRGTEVARVQRELNRRLPPGRHPLAVDGIYGPETESAVRRFQRAAGFQPRLIDGIVGPITASRLFGIFDVKITGTIRRTSSAPPTQPGSPPQSATPPSGNTAPTPRPTGNSRPAAAQSGGGADKDPPPRRFNASAQVGVQGSARDGGGAQVHLAVTARTRDYLTHPSARSIYRGVHFEAQLSGSVGIPFPPSSVYTGQLSASISPVTDGFVLWDRLHLFTPTISAFGQVPLNHPSEGGSDPSLHPRLGGAVGLELFHFDIIRDHLSVGVQGQASGYWDFDDHRFIWDPSVLGFLQGQFGFGPRVSPPRR
jgi:peptidoglycan hydrolase-like protein with peptidoglycan-binding domain